VNNLTKNDSLIKEDREFYTPQEVQLKKFSFKEYD